MSTSDLLADETLGVSGRERESSSVLGFLLCFLWWSLSLSVVGDGDCDGVVSGRRSRPISLATSVGVLALGDEIIGSADDDES